MTTLRTVYEQGRLIRGAWSDTDAEGRQLLCLMTALVGDPGVRPETCPADKCPPWLAHLLPWFDDAPSVEAWHEIIEECIAQAPYWGRMTAAQSRYLDLYCRRVAVVEAREHCPTEEAATLAAIDRVLALLDRALAGDEPTCDEWAAAEAAAWAAREAAREAARKAAWAAREAAWAAARAACATAAATAAVAAAAAAAGLAWVAEAASCDRMIRAMLAEMRAVLIDGKPVPGGAA